MKSLQRFFEVPVLDPDWSRRRRLLNILLAGLAMLSAVTILATAFYAANLNELLSSPEALVVLEAGGAILSACVLAFLINKTQLFPGWMPAVLLLTILYVALMGADSPAQLVNGRSLVVWVIPIVIAPIILPPGMAFAMATVSSGIISMLTLQSGVDASQINIFAIAALFALALVTWLSARTLEQSAQAARREAAQTRTMLDSISDGVVVFDKAHQVIRTNPAMLGMMARDKLRTLPLEGRAEMEDGRVLEVISAAVPELGTVAVARDVTRQAELERMKDAMLGTVSHELRTPLGAILGFAEVIRLTSPAPASDHARRIVNGAKRLLNLVNNLLDRAQIAAGVLHINEKPYEPRKVADEVAGLFKDKAAEKGIRFELAVDDCLPRLVVGDAERVLQVAINLVDNAVKFTDQGYVAICFWGADEHWGFTVSDTGVGIAAERLPDIFEPFRRASDYDTRRQQGAGLGLSIVKELVQRMNGEISFDSRLGEGSTFTVKFPLYWER